MIKFTHQINQSEVNSEYINLIGLDHTKYGPKIGIMNKEIVAVDDHGQKYAMKRHHGNQLTRCTLWYRQNNIVAKDQIDIWFEETEKDEGKPVIHIGGNPKSPARFVVKSSFD